jgi:hypothetical protein
MATRRTTPCRPAITSNDASPAASPRAVNRRKRGQYRNCKATRGMTPAVQGMSNWQLVVPVSDNDSAHGETIMNLWCPTFYIWNRCANHEYCGGGERHMWSPDC